MCCAYSSSKVIGLSCRDNVQTLPYCASCANQVYPAGSSSISFIVHLIEPYESRAVYSTSFCLPPFHYLDIT